MARFLRRTIGLAVVVAIGWALWRWWNGQDGPTTFAGEVGQRAAAWVEPEDGGVCPVTHPVKAKLTSGIFHVPGGLSYGRTVADRCYRDPGAAVTDGLRAAKR